MGCSTSRMASKGQSPTTPTARADDDQREMSALEPTSAEEQFALADKYFTGRGADQDYERALEWASKAAQQGHAKAQRRVGFHLDAGKGVAQDPAAAVSWYRRSAEQGDAGAQYNLGVRYYNGGRGVEQSYETAFAYILKAAHQGHAAAQARAGRHYDKGKGVAQDYVEAVTWYRRAAEQGDAGAAHNLGVRYFNGEGVIKDRSQGLAWWRKSAALGYSAAAASLHQVLSAPNTAHLALDAQEAKRWLRVANQEVSADAAAAAAAEDENDVGQSLMMSLSNISLDFGVATSTTKGTSSSNDAATGTETGTGTDSSTSMAAAAVMPSLRHDDRRQVASFVVHRYINVNVSTSTSVGATNGDFSCSTSSASSSTSPSILASTTATATVLAPKSTAPFSAPELIWNTPLRSRVLLLNRHIAQQVALRASVGREPTRDPAELFSSELAPLASAELARLQRIAAQCKEKYQRLEARSAVAEKAIDMLVSVVRRRRAAERCSGVPRQPLPTWHPANSDDATPLVSSPLRPLLPHGCVARDDYAMYLALRARWAAPAFERQLRGLACALNAASHPSDIGLSAEQFPLGFVPHKLVLHDAPGRNALIWFGPPKTAATIVREAGRKDLKALPGEADSSSVDGDADNQSEGNVAERSIDDDGDGDKAPALPAARYLLDTLCAVLTFEDPYALAAFATLVHREMKVVRARDSLMRSELMCRSCPGDGTISEFAPDARAWQHAHLPGVRLNVEIDDGRSGYQDEQEHAGGTQSVFHEPHIGEIHLVLQDVAAIDKASQLYRRLQQARTYADVIAPLAPYATRDAARLAPPRCCPACSFECSTPLCGMCGMPMAPSAPNAQRVDAPDGWSSEVERRATAEGVPPADLLGRRVRVDGLGVGTVVGPYKKGAVFGLGATKHKVMFDMDVVDGTEQRPREVLLRRNNNGGLGFVLIDY